GLLLLALGLYMGLLQIIHETPEEAFQTIVFVLCTLPCLIMAVPQLSRSYEQCCQMFRLQMWVAAIWAFCCSVQFVLDPSKLVSSQGRFFGMLANAQQVAMFCAPLATIILWFVIEEKRFTRKMFYGVLLGTNILFLVWTGSRMGILIFGIGFIFVLYSRL